MKIYKSMLIHSISESGMKGITKVVGFFFVVAHYVERFGEFLFLCMFCSVYANEIKIEKKIKCIFRWLWSTEMVYTQLIELNDVINYMGSLDCHSSRVFTAFCFVSSQNCSTCLFQCLFFLWTENKLTNMC